MTELPFVLTIFVMLLGPIRLIPAFASLTKGADIALRRGVALRGAAVATAIVFFLALAGPYLVAKYRLSVESLALGGGVVLLISALQSIFEWPRSKPDLNAEPLTLQMGFSPLGTPMIVPPVGVAAILIFVMLEKTYPGIGLAVLIALAIVMPTNLLVMVFNDRILRIPGLIALLRILGAVLVFIQVALATQMISTTLRTMGLFHLSVRLP